MPLDDLLSLVLEAAMLLANDSHAADTTYRAGYQTALLNILILAKIDKDETEEIKHNLRKVSASE